MICPKCRSSKIVRSDISTPNSDISALSALYNSRLLRKCNDCDFRGFECPHCQDKILQEYNPFTTAPYFHVCTANSDINAIHDIRTNFFGKCKCGKNSIICLVCYEGTVELSEDPNGHARCNNCNCPYSVTKEQKESIMQFLNLCNDDH